MTLVLCFPQIQTAINTRRLPMLKILLKILFAPFALLDALFGWLFNVAKPTPARQAVTRQTSAKTVAALLDAEEAKEIAAPTLPRPAPVLLPPQAAMAWSWSLMTGLTKRPDLSSVSPSVAGWIRSLTLEEARAIHLLSPRDLADHVYARRAAPGLRPMIYGPVECAAAARLADGEDVYVDDLLPALR
jgi:hypothetical protein